MNSLQKKALWRIPQGEDEKLLYILEDYLSNNRNYKIVPVPALKFKVTV